MSNGSAPALPERKRGEGVRLVYEVLRDEILNLVLLPGSPVDENQLAEQFSMSRTPIREALVRLASEGLVQTLPNRSTVVSNIDFANLNQFFEAITLMYRVTTRLAAENRTEADLDAIRAHQADFVRAVEARDARAMISTNRDLHAAISEAGRNQYYTSLFSRLLDDGRRILRIYYYSSYDDRLPARYVEEHDRMIEAIAARDVEAADRIATMHADQIVEQIQQMITHDHRQKIPLSRAR